METMSCGNLTDFCINCYQDTGRHNTIYTVLASCLCYIAGILSVIMVIFIRKLKKRKLWCFKEKEEPFKGKWEGASQRATIQVLKKHTLEQGSSLEKSMKLESSVEVKNELDDSSKHSGKTTSNDKLDLEKSEEKHNDDANTDESKIKNARPDLSKETDSLEASVQRSDKSEENPNTEIKSKLEGTDTLKSNGDQDVDKSLDTDNGQVEQDKEVLTVKMEAQESHKACTRDNDKADDVEKSGKLEIDITEDGKVTGDAIKDAGNETNDKGDSPVVVNEGEKEVPLIGEVKGDNSVADGVKEKVPVIDGGKLKVPVIGEVKEDVPVIVCDSTGAELYEKGRESSMYDHDDLIVQNDNFRISQLSAN